MLDAVANADQAEARGDTAQGGTLALAGLTSRTLATVEGEDHVEYVVVNEFRGNQTRVISVTPDDD